MAQSSSSQDLRNLQSSGSAIKPQSRTKIKTKDKKAQQKPSGPQQTLRVVASFTSVQELTQLSGSQRFPRLNSLSLQCLDGDKCSEAPPVKEPFNVRIQNGKEVRDVLIDTHDLINEPGGFVINLSHHNQGADSKELRIHLGIKERRRPQQNKNPCSKNFRPPALTTTYDYAREIFRAIRSCPELESLTAILEINNEEDRYEQKVLASMSPEFLEDFIQTYPIILTKFHVEIPGASPVYLPEWKFLLDQQFFLKILICNFGVVLWTFYEDCVIRNSSTLEKIILRRLQTYDVQNAKFIPFNWQTFSECKRLTYLKITCGYKHKGKPHLNLPQPPSSVFLHENLEDLPTEDTFRELHLGNIWVSPCVLDDFCSARPNLTLCVPCNDREYYDGEDKEDTGRMDYDLQLVSASIVNLRAEIRQSSPAGSMKGPRRRRERQMACMVLVLFHIILMALGLLFVIIYFRHLRGGRQKDFKKPL